MKFSIPFFGKRKTDDSSAPQGSSGEPTSASTSSPAHERVIQPVAPEGEKKPFVVPESTKAMPSFSQAAELANLEEIQASLNAQSLAQKSPQAPPQAPSQRTQSQSVTSTPAQTPTTSQAPVASAPSPSVSTSEPITAAVKAPVSSESSAAPLAPAPHVASTLESTATQAPTPAAEVTPASSASTSESVTAQTVISAVEAPKQMESMVMSAEDIIAAYKIFLKRLPENMQVIQPRVGLTSDRILYDFITSGEFLARSEVPNVILALAKKIIDEQKAKLEKEAPAPAAETASSSLGG